MPQVFYRTLGFCTGLTSVSLGSILERQLSDRTYPSQGLITPLPGQGDSRFQLHLELTEGCWQ
jgi:hypothetical protein